MASLSEGQIGGSDGGPTCTGTAVDEAEGGPEGSTGGGDNGMCQRTPRPPTRDNSLTAESESASPDLKSVATPKVNGDDPLGADGEDKGGPCC